MLSVLAPFRSGLCYGSVWHKIALFFLLVSFSGCFVRIAYILWARLNTLRVNFVTLGLVEI